MIIVDGRLRQTVDTHTRIVDVDLTPILGNLSMSIAQLKKIVALLGTLQDGNDITIKCSEDDITFKNSNSRLTFKQAISGFLIEKHIDEKIISDMMITKDENKLFTIVLNQDIVDKLRKQSQLLSSTEINMECRDNNIKLCVSDAQKTVQTVFNCDNVTVYENNIACILPISLFSIPTDSDLTFEFWKMENEDESLYIQVKNKYKEYEINSYIMEEYEQLN